MVDIDYCPHCNSRLKELPDDLKEIVENLFIKLSCSEEREIEAKIIKIELERLHKEGYNVRLYVNMFNGNRPKY